MNKPKLACLPPIATPAERHYWSNLPGASLAYVLSQTILQKPAGATLVICESTATAYQLEVELGAFLKESEVETLHLPDWETLPYDSFSPHQDIVSQRLLTLYRLQSMKQGVMVVSISSLLNRLPPVEYINRHSLHLACGDKVSINRLRQQFESVGYRCTETVYEHGEYAVRGSLFDIFPMGSSSPYRVDLFDDEIESIRFFDPETQKTIEAVDRIALLPAREFPMDKAAINLFQDAWHEAFPHSDAKKCPIYRDVAAGLPPPGIEYYLPLFFEQTQSLIDYLPENTSVFALGNIESSAEQFWRDIRYRYEQYGVDPLKPLLAPDRIYLKVNHLFERLKPYPLTYCSNERQENTKIHHFTFPFKPCPDLAINHRLQTPLIKLQNAIFDNHGKIILCAETAGRQQVLLELLEKIQCLPTMVDSLEDALQADDPIVLVIAPLSSGFSVEAETTLLFITEKELFGEKILQSRRRKKDNDRNSDAIIRNLTELTVGAPVVHLEHGVGRYEGMTTLTVDDLTSEYIQLLYADEARLYVPVSSLHLISRYSGADEDHAPLHRLGSEQWSKARRKAAEQIRDVAAELLDINARRASRKGYAFRHPDADFALFS
ncbi:MAG: transcription-repair coupling factor, partial [Pseudomonadales bacterium]|nr:transcription-repair coupling factor [Pseudomonadales bacterium]